MKGDDNPFDMVEKEAKASEITYNPEKDFYKGIGGELRMKAEGLFKKAKEKGISIEEIDIQILKENYAEFPGIGTVELPAYVAKVKGRHVQSGQAIIDGKQIDYYNRYQKYVAEKIENINLLKDEKGKPIKEGGKVKVKPEIEFVMSEWERFEIGKNLINDKEFGLEKTITGACDRLIRKLMGENDWLYPEEARLLEEEFNSVQAGIIKERQMKKETVPGIIKKATERQINYLKAKIKNSGLDPENEAVIREVLRQNGYESNDILELSAGEASKVIDNFSNVIPRVKEVLKNTGYIPALSQTGLNETEGDFKQ